MIVSLLVSAASLFFASWVILFKCAPGIIVPDIEYSCPRQFLICTTVLNYINIFTL